MFSFTDQKSINDLLPYIRRMCDLTTPNLTRKSLSGRSENRYNRAIPTLLSPWRNSKPVLQGTLVCLTCDLADRGVGLIVNQACQLKTVVVGYWIPSAEMTEPWFFLGEVRRSQEIGGGYWSMGVELAGMANLDDRLNLGFLPKAAETLLPTARF
jgi:hypothetical protein